VCVEELVEPGTARAGDLADRSRRKPAVHGDPVGLLVARASRVRSRLSTAVLPLQPARGRRCRERRPPCGPRRPVLLRRARARCSPVGDAPQRGGDGAPVDVPRAGHQVLVARPAVVRDVQVDEPPGERPEVRRGRVREQVPVEVRVSHVDADPEGLPALPAPSAGNASVTVCRTSIAPFSSASLTERSRAYDRIPRSPRARRCRWAAAFARPTFPTRARASAGARPGGPPEKRGEIDLFPDRRGIEPVNEPEWRLTPGFRGRRASARASGRARRAAAPGSSRATARRRTPGGCLRERGEEPGLGAEGFQPVPGAEAVAHGAHPLSVWCISDEMNCRRAAMKVRRRGAMITTAAAMTMSHRVPASASAKYTMPAAG